MVFCTVIMSIIELSAFLTQIWQDQRKGGPLRGTVCLLEEI